MDALIEKKIKLDFEIEKLIEDFAIKNKCGYKGTIEVSIVKERVDSESFIVGMHKEINTVITS